MNRLFTILLIVVGAMVCPWTLTAQDSELGGLPPIPDLDLGDPTDKQGLFKKAKSNRKAVRDREESNVYTRPADQPPEASFGQRMTKAIKGKPQTGPSEQTINVNNKISSSDNATTASGQLLKPFGEEEEYWPEEMMVAQEDPLAILPPLPDFRTPDQVSSKEKRRNLRVARYEQRKAENDARRMAKEQERAATVNLAPPDPSTALVQVESQRRHHENYVGNMEAPETPNKRELKPFDPGSTYVQNDTLVYRGDKPPRAAQVWWARGTQGESADSDDRKFRWFNPFRTSGDVPEVQSRPGRLPEREMEPAGSQTYSGGSPSLDATPLTSNLRGILVVRTTQDVRRSGLGSVSGLQTDGVDLPPRVASVFDSRIGSSLTLGGLNQMVRDAVIAYRRSDLPVVDVLVPEQEIQSGVLQLVIIEGRLGDVIVEGTNNNEARSLAGQIQMERGDEIRESDLLQDLSWINKHPSRRVDLVYSPGGGYGETDVILRSNQYNAVSAYAAYENSGTDILGTNRAIFGASWTGPLFFDVNSILSYQYTSNFDEQNDLWGHSGVFASYLPWQHQLTFLGAYTESFSRRNVAGITLQSGGFNKQGSVRYAVPLPSVGRMTHEFELGLDQKSTNSDLAFNGARVFDTTSEILQYSLGYNILARDDTGTWRLEMDVVDSPGNATGLNTDAIFGTQRGGATAQYTYGRVRIERDQDLLAGWTGHARLDGQLANANLLASETLGAGGYDSVRGFEQRFVQGDRGIVGSLELRTPTFFPSNFLGFSNVQDAGRGLIFYDHGSVTSEILLPGEVDRSIGSVGAGFRYQLENWFTLRVDYGLQVSESGVDDGEEGRWHIGARATF